MKIVIEQWERKRPISQFEDEIFIRQERKKISFSRKNGLKLDASVVIWNLSISRQIVQKHLISLGLLNHLFLDSESISRKNILLKWKTKAHFFNFAEDGVTKSISRKELFAYFLKKSLTHFDITETHLITYFVHKKVLGRIYLWVWYPKIVYMSPAASCSAY